MRTRLTRAPNSSARWRKVSAGVRRRGRALGERTHFGGDDREAAALLAGTCGLDRCVQREDVGLEGDAVDHGRDLGDVPRVGGCCSLLACWRYLFAYSK